MRIKKIEAGSFYTYLSDGCRLCRRGSKLVLFVTGLCPHSCFYCPISKEKWQKDVIFANERPIKTYNDLIDEINLMSAEGASITGGEPLVKLERVIEFLKLLKKFDLHVHLYTSLPVKEHVIERLSKAGLDEIRFHPPELKNPNVYVDSILASKKFKIETGFEVPSIMFCKEIAKISNQYDIFLNLNELEFSDTNFEKLKEKGFEANGLYGTKGSIKIANEYLKNVKKFHYCTARFKDLAQLRRRFIRMAFNHPEFYMVTRDGTLICGFIEGKKERLEEIKKLLKRLNQEYIEVERGIETSVEFTEKWHKELKRRGLKVSVIERYPTSKRIVIEVLPL